jgi:hypothetical protein
MTKKDKELYKKSICLNIRKKITEYQIYYLSLLHIKKKQENILCSQILRLPITEALPNE